MTYKVEAFLIKKIPKQGRNFLGHKYLKFKYRTRHYFRHFKKLPKNQKIKIYTALFLLFLLIAGGIFYLLTRPDYHLSSTDLKLLSTPDKKLISSSLTFDKKTDIWTINKQGIKSGNSSSSTQGFQIGKSSNTGSATYSATIPQNLSKGVTYYDNITNLSFTLTPTFKIHPGKQVKNYLVYPINHSAQVLYTIKSDGVKEDLILNSKPSSNSMAFSYKLNLPNTLVAKEISNGSIGIYSADPALFGNISFGTSTDQQAVMNARVKGPKNHLVFLLTPPVVKQLRTQDNSAKTSYSFANNILTLRVSNLKNEPYPLTIDPTVLINTTGGFNLGNGITDASISSNQVSEAGLTGGSLSAGFTNNTSGAQVLSSARQNMASTVYNGYIYILGGQTSGATNSNVVQYATTGSNGALAAPASCPGTLTGDWCSTTNLPSAASWPKAVAYNGYMYIDGGFTTGHTFYYTTINSDGSLGASWTLADTGITNATEFGGLQEYNGYLYIIGGLLTSDGCTMENNVNYAAIKGDGSLASWATTTSFTTGRELDNTAVYNGYLYMWGGINQAATCGNNNGLTSQSDLQYVPINSDGTLGTWVASSFTLPHGAFNTSAGVYQGYLYTIAGSTDAPTGCPALCVQHANNYNNVSLAAINSDGSIGPWIDTSNIATDSACSPTTVIYQNYVYVLGGVITGCTVYTVDTQYANIDSTGFMGNSASTTTLPNNYTNISTVAYNGRVYLVGGCYATCPGTGSWVATISSSGSLGSWSSTGSSLAAIRLGALVAYNNYLYYIAGTNGTIVNTIQFAPITQSTGALGTWSTTTHALNAVEFNSAVAYNGYMYELGGNATGTVLSEVDYAPINSTTGAIGTWNTTTSLPFNFQSAEAVAYNGYIYMMGGNNTGTGNVNNAVYYDSINSNGTLGGSWTSTTNLPTNLNDFVAFANNGYLYIMGGITSGTTCTQAAYYININSNGTIGSSWTSLPNITGANPGSGGVGFGGGYSNGYVYYLASNSNTSDFYAPIYNGGSGITQSESSTTAFTEARFLTSTVAYNGFLYVIGGAASTSAADCINAGNLCNGVQYAPINNNGTIGTWNSTTAFTQARDLAGAFAYNGYMYLVGGISNSSGNDCTASNGSGNFFCNGTQYAQINSNGTLGSWTASSTFTLARGGSAFAEYNGYLYVMGGVSNTSSNDCTATSNYCNGVQYAQINTSTHAIGSWSTTSAFTQARYALTSTVYNGYMYILGGVSSTSANDCTATNNLCYGVQYAQINSDGTIGSWTYTNNFILARWYTTAFAYNGYLYLAGGQAGNSLADCTLNTTMCNGVQFAPIYNNGAIGGWNYTTNFTQARYGLSSAVYNGYMYIIGGDSTTSANDCTAVSFMCNGVQYAGLQTIPRIATYNDNVDITGISNDDGFIASFIANGSNTGNLESGNNNGLGGIEVKYALADNSCTTFSTYQNAFYPINTLGNKVTATNLTSGCSGTINNGRYMRLIFILDDSQTATFPDSGSNHSAISGITIYYHPSPGHRLRGGKTFTSTGLQSLDAPP